MIERRVVQPSRDWLTLHEQVQKTVAKRDRKLIDYDRSRDAVKRSKDNTVQSTDTDEKKVYKVS